MAGNPALAGAPVAGWEIVQHLNELVLVQEVPEGPRVVLVGKEIFDALESRSGRRGETLDERHVVEEHREIGGKLWHALGSRTQTFNEHEPFAFRKLPYRL